MEEDRFATRDNERATLHVAVISLYRIYRYVDPFCIDGVRFSADVLCTRLLHGNTGNLAAGPHGTAGVYVTDRCQSTGRSKLVNERGDLTVNLTLFAGRVVASGGRGRESSVSLERRE